MKLSFVSFRWFIIQTVVAHISKTNSATSPHPLTSKRNLEKYLHCCEIEPNVATDQEDLKKYFPKETNYLCKLSCIYGINFFFPHFWNCSVQKMKPWLMTVVLKIFWQTLWVVTIWKSVSGQVRTSSSSRLINNIFLIFFWVDVCYMAAKL